MAANPKETIQNKKPGFFQWFIVITVPIIFALIITGIILSIIGVDVIGKTKETLNKVPVINEWVQTDEEKTYEHQLENKENTISRLEEELELERSQLASKDKTIENLQTEIDNLIAQLEGKETEEQLQSEDQTAQKKVIRSFSEMKPKEAAPIMENMDEQLVNEILQGLDEKTVARILAEMEPDLAASYIKEMAE